MNFRVSNLLIPVGVRSGTEDGQLAILRIDGYFYVVWPNFPREVGDQKRNH